MSLTLQTRAEPIPGYRLLKPLGRGGFGEVWKCTAPGGLVKAIKFVRSGGGFEEAGEAAQEQRALETVLAIHHPYLLAMDRIEVIDGVLVVVMELAEGSLADRLRERRAEGFPGLPRDALLGYFREAAEALDLLNFRHGLQHLDVKPHNLLLLGGHVKVADFGLVSRLPDEGEEAAPRPAGAVSPMYASPEAFRGTPSPFSDQYSLAVAYHELLTGELPFAGANPRLLALQHAQAEPDLRRLPKGDRAVVVRALAKEPGRRFASCAEFARALALQSARPAAAESVAARPDPRLAETQPGIAARSDLHKTPAAPGAARQAVLADCRFEECLSRTRPGEFWAARTTTGDRVFVRFYYGLGGLDGAARRDALQLLEGVRHPGLLPYSLVHNDGARLVLVTPGLGPTLRDRLRQCRGAGRRGIPRAELLTALRAVARTLDALHGRHGVPHLGLNPDSLQLVNGQARAAGFGLAVWLGLPGGQVLAEANPRYSAPELWINSANLCCDSYSLALIFQEMLTGVHPFGGGPRPGSRQYARPDLNPLSAADRAVLTRALELKPGRRFDSCVGLIAALENSAERPSTRPAPEAPAPVADALPPERLIAEVIAAAAEGWQTRGNDLVRRPLSAPRRLRQRFVTAVNRGTAPLLLADFCRRWHARLTEERDDALVYRIIRGEDEESGLAASLQYAPHATSGLFRLRIGVNAFGRDVARGAARLKKHGSALLEDLCDALRAYPERRREARLRYDHLIEIDATLEAAAPATRVQARIKDLSRIGIGLLLADRPAATPIVVYLSPGGNAPGVPVPARIVRVQALPNGYEVGARFLATAEEPGR